MYIDVKIGEPYPSVVHGGPGEEAHTLQQIRGQICGDQPQPTETLLCRRAGTFRVPWCAFIKCAVGGLKSRCRSSFFNNT